MRNRDVVDLRWLSARSWTLRWYPQGIDIGEFHGRRTLATSWFRQDMSGTHLASRVTLIDLERKRHLDVALALSDEDGGLSPAPIHAGGIAWFGDRLYVAATWDGIWEFDLGKIRRVRGAEARKVTGSTSRFSLRSIDAHVVTRTRVHKVPLRCSFIGRTFATDGGAEDTVLIGEYRADTAGRVAAYNVSEDALTAGDVFHPGIAQMQGAVRMGERFFISQSDGLHAGTLWTGPDGAIIPSTVALPKGPEDLALDPAGKRLWTLGEHPWNRVVRGIPLQKL